MSLMYKTGLRRQLKARSVTNMPRFNRNHPATMAQTVLQLIESLERKHIIAVYNALPDEVDSQPFVQALQNYSLALPVVIDEGYPLIFRAWEPGERLVKDHAGVSVPPGDAQVVIPDVIVMPVMGYNPDGYRLGRGGGFYDRTILELPEAVTIGVVASFQKIDFNPDSHDCALDYIVTEHGIERAPGAIPQAELVFAS